MENYQRIWRYFFPHWDGGLGRRSKWWVSYIDMPRQMSVHIDPFVCACNMYSSGKNDVLPYMGTTWHFKKWKTQWKYCAKTLSFLRKKPTWQNISRQRLEQIFANTTSALTANQTTTSMALHWSYKENYIFCFSFVWCRHMSLKFLHNSSFLGFDYRY